MIGQMNDNKMISILHTTKNHSKLPYGNWMLRPASLYILIQQQLGIVIRQLLEIFAKACHIKHQIMIYPFKSNISRWERNILV